MNHMVTMLTCEWNCKQHTINQHSNPPVFFHFALATGLAEPNSRRFQRAKGKQKWFHAGWGGNRGTFRATWTANLLYHHYWPIWCFQKLCSHVVVWGNPWQDPRWKFQLSQVGKLIDGWLISDVTHWFAHAGFWESPGFSFSLSSGSQKAKSPWQLVISGSQTRNFAHNLEFLANSGSVHLH